MPCILRIPTRRRPVMNRPSSLLGNARISDRNGDILQWELEDIVHTLKNGRHRKTVLTRLRRRPESECRRFVGPGQNTSPVVLRIHAEAYTMAGVLPGCNVVQVKAPTKIRICP